MVKIKPLTKEQIIISTDRLTRFKNPEIKYLRVFKDIIISNLIEPKFKKSELDEMDYSKLRDLAQEIINTSLPQKDTDFSINQKLYDYETSTFNTDEATKNLLKNKINYTSIISLIEEENLPINLKWLKSLAASTSFEENRRRYSLRFPLTLVVLAEGITEETLLPEFAKLCDYDFDKNGIKIISAGGKNQVVKLFYRLAESLKLPIFVLMDQDAQENYNEIKPKLRPIDKVHLLKCGEFEDLLPISLIKKSLNYGLKNISIIDPEELKSENGMVKTLEEIFRHKGMHEFKKAEFAQTVKLNLSSNSDISPEIEEIIREIKSTTLK